MAAPAPISAWTKFLEKHGDKSQEGKALEVESKYDCEIKMIRGHQDKDQQVRRFLLTNRAIYSIKDESKNKQWKLHLEKIDLITKSSHAQSPFADHQFIVHVPDKVAKDHDYQFECESAAERDDVIAAIMEQANAMVRKEKLQVNILHASYATMCDIASSKKILIGDLRSVETKSDDEQKTSKDDEMLFGGQKQIYQQPRRSAAHEKGANKRKKSNGFLYTIFKRPKDDKTGRKATRPKRGGGGGGGGGAYINTYHAEAAFDAGSCDCSGC